MVTSVIYGLEETNTGRILAEGFLDKDSLLVIVGQIEDELGIDRKDMTMLKLIRETL